MLAFNLWGGGQEKNAAKYFNCYSKGRKSIQLLYKLEIGVNIINFELVFSAQEIPEGHHDGDCSSVCQLWLILDP